MKNRCWPLISLCLLLVYGSVPAAEFTADLTVSEGNMVKEGRILVSGERYRMELDDPSGPAAVVQVLPGDNVCRVLIPRYNQYIEIGLDNGMLGMFDPFTAAESMKKYYTVVPVGEESIAGQVCEKEAFKYDDTPALYRWKAKALGFPLKILMVSRDGYYTELKNVKLEAIAPAMFAVPDGYTKTDWPGIRDKVDQDPAMVVKKKAWAARQPSTKTLNPMLAAGDEFRVLVGENLAIKIKVHASGNDDIAWSVAALKNGSVQPAQEMSGPGEWDFAADSGTNGIVLKCLQGQLRGEISLKGLGQLVLATRTLQRKDSGSGLGSSLPPEITAFRLRIKSLETPGESKLPVRIDLTLEKASKGSGSDESINKRLEPGQETTIERKGQGVVGGYDLSLIGPGGRAELEMTVDYRPPEKQQPF